MMAEGEGIRKESVFLNLDSHISVDVYFIGAPLDVAGIKGSIIQLRHMICEESEDPSIGIWDAVEINTNGISTSLGHSTQLIVRDLLERLAETSSRPKLTLHVNREFRELR